MSGVVATVKEFFSPESANVSRLEEAVRLRRTGAEEAARKASDAQRALETGDVPPVPGVKALGAARAALAAALVDVEDLEAALRKAMLDLDTKEKARAAAVEVKRQAGLVVEAEKIDGELRKVFANFVTLATRSVSVCSEITGYEKARFDLPTLMSDIAFAAAGGAPRVTEIQPPLLPLALPARPALDAVLADAGFERKRRLDILRAPVAPPPAGEAVKREVHGLEDREAS